ncbi:transposase [Streptomyces sp. NPDC058548]|uniref:transposase n=1 Tax=Streptomyces sp. NPDC058548 TaxID=3346545 RepID=UPI00365EFE86
MDRIRFRVRTDAPWWDVPVEYGPWNRVYDLFRRWQRNGTWHRTPTRLQSLERVMADRARPQGRVAPPGTLLLCHAPA